MKDRGLVLLAVASLSLLGASDLPLNPLVMRRAEPSAAAPAECAEGISEVPLSPRIEIADVQMPAEVASAPASAPPSGLLREQLRATRDALSRNDRAAFDAALASVKQTLAAFPRGGDRTVAEELVRIWSDVARVWDAQFESPFFGEDSPLYATLNAYSGFAGAMGERVLIDDRNRKFYPADESRDFLSRLAAARLGGKSAPAPTPQRRVPTKIRTEDEEDPKTALPPVVVKRAASTPRKSTPKKSTSQTKSAPKVVVPAADPPPSPSATATVAEAPPFFTSATTAATTESLPFEPSPVMGTAAPPPVTETSPQVAPATTTTAVPEPALPEPRSKGSGYLLPAMLILVGLGVLVLLFKTSS